VTEKVRPGEVARAQEEELDWGDLGREEWGARELEQALGENACVQNVERVSPTKQERLAPL